MGLSVIDRSDPGVAIVNSIDFVIADFARCSSSEVAVLYRLNGRGGPEPISSVGTRGSYITQMRPGRGGFVGRALSLERAALEPLDVVQDAGLIDASRPPLTHAAAAAVRIATGVVGALIAGFATVPDDRAWMLWATESYAALIGLCLQSTDDVGSRLLPARWDGLTGCLTYDALLDQLSREIDRCARKDLDLSVCFIDLDGFKRVNDCHGHASGNRVLAQVAEVLRATTRSFDALGRYGGDEFVAILPQTDERAAEIVADRLRSAIAAINIQPLGHAVTASVGVAQWKPGSSAEQLLDRADTALLRAKAARRAVGQADAAGT